MSNSDKRQERIENLVQKCRKSKDFWDILSTVKAEYPFHNNHTQREYAETVFRILNPEVKV